MKKFFGLTLAALSLTAITGGVTPRAQAATEEPVTIHFQAAVGEQPFRCGEAYRLGTPAAMMMPADFRFYISAVELIDAAGNAVPVTLEQDSKWQYQNVALLDFEDKTGACVNGTAETRDRIVGTVPAGDYQGLRFTLGIPFALNHEDATLAPSPLNLTSMWWNWRGGYKFVRVDLEPHQTAAAPSQQPKSDGHSQPEGDRNQPGDGHSQHGREHGEAGGHADSVGFAIHLGSTGCQIEGDSPRPTACLNPNRVTVTFDDFDPAQNIVVADLAALVADSDLTVNVPNTPAGCMSSPDDSDCVGVMQGLGLPFADAAAVGQAFFQVGDR